MLNFEIIKNPNVHKIQIIIKFKRLIRFDRLNSIQSNRTAWSNQNQSIFFSGWIWCPHNFTICLLSSSSSVNQCVWIATFFPPLGSTLPERWNVWKSVRGRKRGVKWNSIEASKISICKSNGSKSLDSKCLKWLHFFFGTKNSHFIIIHISSVCFAKSQTPNIVNTMQNIVWQTSPMWANYKYPQTHIHIIFR